MACVTASFTWKSFLLYFVVLWSQLRLFCTFIYYTKAATEIIIENQMLKQAKGLLKNHFQFIACWWNDCTSLESRTYVTGIFSFERAKASYSEEGPFFKLPHFKRGIPEKSLLWKSLQLIFPVQSCSWYLCAFVASYNHRPLPASNSQSASSGWIIT